MEIWLDTCNTKAAQAAGDFGLIYGITTNPSILASSSEDPEKTIASLLDIQDGPIAVQVTHETTEEIIESARALYNFSSRIIVKIPVTTQGLMAMRRVIDEEIPVMATAVFHPRQALLAGLIGADYVAPYIGRMFDAGIEAYTSLQSMINLLSKYECKTKIIAAALRTRDQIMACGEMGIQAVTIKTSLFDELIEDDPLTVESLKSFSEDWQARNFSHYSLKL